MSEIDDTIKDVANMYKPSKFNSFDHFLKTIKSQTRILIGYKFGDLFFDDAESIAKLREYIDDKVDGMKDNLEKKYNEEGGYNFN